MTQPEKGQHRLRLGRISIPEIDYFVTSCVEERRPILDQESARSMLHESLAYCETSRVITWHCYTIMPDHLHMLFTLHHVKTLKGFMESFKRWTSRRINVLKCGSSLQRARTFSGSDQRQAGQAGARLRRRGRASESPPTSAGQVWQENYFDHRLRSAKDFNETVLYIFFNPVEDGLTKDPWLWPGWQAKPEIEEWLKRWETEEKKITDWQAEIRRKKDIYK